ncbi:MAG: hypothetical protein HW403_949, partial [Dehalococcoidia bacterium]|nr:hypothetical protein [Dehalococcoidia bacterium]
MQREIADDLNALLETLPPHVTNLIHLKEDHTHILEVVLDLGRPPEVRYPDGDIILGDREVTQEEIEYVMARIGDFGDDNRAGIERTLHRISAIRNRKGTVVGLTCRVGRAVYGTVKLIEDLVQSGKNIMLLGRPGVGKTTMLREVARVLSDDMKKRVIVVDTSNEIAGDGDIPHPAIGHARRMQVKTPALQHAVMIEAVENHMPEVIIIDEMGTELEAAAARTIAERGVQLIATAHGNTLENLLMNPTLSDLVGGIQSVTLGDEEARRRGTQKSILERKAPPTFDVVVEIQGWNQVAVHPDVAAIVDTILRGNQVQPEVRNLGTDGQVTAVGARRQSRPARNGGTSQPEPGVVRSVKVYPFGLSRARISQAIRATQMPITLVDRLEDSDALVTLRHYYRRKPQTLRDAEASGIPIYAVKSHALVQLEQCLIEVCSANRGGEPVMRALREAEEAAMQVMNN